MCVCACKCAENVTYSVLGCVCCVPVLHISLAVVFVVNNITAGLL